MMPKQRVNLLYLHPAYSLVDPRTCPSRPPIASLFTFIARIRSLREGNVLVVSVCLCEGAGSPHDKSNGAFLLPST